MKKLSKLSRFGMLMALMLSVPILVLAQQSKVNFTIKGKVTDGKEGVPGATISLSGTSFGTVTDIDGSYQFSGEAKAGDYTLVYTYIGKGVKSSKVAIGTGNSTITSDVVLGDDALNLGEVVVIGSTISQEKKQLGNAITTVRGDQLTRAGQSDVLAAMSGKVPGAQISVNSGDPSGSISVRLRGAKSLKGSSEPLYVIDGVVVNNSVNNVANSEIGGDSPNAVIGQNRMADINPNDIESISIINGAAAAAVYGSRASNGVVLITTKHGVEGKPVVSFSASVGMSELRKRVPITTLGKMFVPSADPTNPAYVNPKVARLWPLAKAGKFYNESVDVTRYDYQDQIFQQGLNTNNNLSISGGTDKTKYYVSFGYLYNQGIVVGSDNRRLSGKVRLDQKLTDWLDVSAGLTYVNGFSNIKPDGTEFYSPINSLNITLNIYDINQKDAAGNYQSVEPTRVNPNSILRTFNITQQNNRTVGDVKLTARLAPGLSLTYIAGIDNTTELGKVFIPPYPYSPVNGSYWNTGYAANNTAITQLFNNDLNASYQAKWDKFSSNTVAGFSYQLIEGQFSSSQGNDLSPFIQTVSGAATVIPTGFSYSPTSISGYFAQETFGYADKLFLTLAGRVDGSSVFSANNRNQFYPKASISYLLSDEAFWKSSGIGSAISQLKLRGSWGQAGNLTGIPTYGRFYQYSATPYLGLSAINGSSQLANPNVAPERQTETEVGFDASIWKDRIGFNFTYYNQQIKDLLIGRTLAPSQGGSGITTNVGALQNSGVELGLNAAIIRNSNFSWNLYGTLTANKNKVTDIPQGIITIDNTLGAPSVLLKDQPVGVFYGTFYARNPDGSLLLNALPGPGTTSVYTDGRVVFPQREKGVQGADFVSYNTTRDANGQPSGAFLNKIIGDPNPKLIWSVGNNFVLGKLSFNFLLDAVSGVDVFNADKRTRQGVGIGDLAEKELTGALPRGYINSIYQVLEFRVDDGSYIKLREVSASYNFGSLIKGLSNLQLTLIGRNLFSIDHYTGYDPETNSGGASSILRSTDFGNYPIPRTYQVMLKATF